MIKGTQRALTAVFVILAWMVLAQGAFAAVRVKSIRVLPARAALYAMREGVQLTARVSPEAAQNRAVRWKSSRPLIAYVSPEGFVKPIKPGKAVVTATAADGSGVKGRCEVTVKPVVPQGLTLSPAPLVLAPGARKAMAAVIEPTDATDTRLAWSSSDPARAKVSADGVVTGVSPGAATVTCKTVSGGIVARADVNVTYAQTNARYLAVAQSAYRDLIDLPSSAVDARRFIRAFDASDLGQAGSSGEYWRDLSAAQMLSVLADFPARNGLTEDDITYFYYSGHGSGGTLAQRGALVGVDSGLVYVDQIKKCLDQFPGTVVVILDSCYAGQYIASKGQAPDGDPRAFLGAVEASFSRPNAKAKGYTSLTDGPNRAKYRILAACQPLKLSYVIEGASAFTEFLCEAAGVAGEEILPVMPGDKNGDGRLTVPEIYRYAAPRVVRRVRAYKFKQTIMVWPKQDAFAVFGRATVN